VAAVNDRHENTAYLPGIELPPGVRATGRLDEALADAEAVLVVVPSEFCRGIYREAGRLAPPGAVFVSATKGLEIDTLQRMSEVAEAEAPGRPVAVLSGPSFALEVARGLPTAVVVASSDHDVAKAVQQPLATRTFRVYSSEDVVGVELAGALKNVIAIAAGIVDGLKLGQNTRAALLTRGVAEIRRLGMRLGGLAETFSGLAGVGDLILTATGDLSRNRRVGLALASGKSIEEALSALGGEVAEGVPTAGAIVELARSVEVVMPISETVTSILSGATAPREAVSQLMTRSLKEEGS